MVRVGGVEPPTAWFVARYSIQLSYTRKFYFSVIGLLNGARGRSRTSDRLVRSQVLYPAELHAHSNITTIEMVRMEGVEPSTAWFVARYSIQLSYIRIDLTIVRNGGEGGIRTLDGI
jgi:hypothetical protein